MIEDFSLLYSAITHRQPDDLFVERVRAMSHDASRAPDDFPRFIRDIARDLAAGRIRGPIEISDRDRGYSWLLADLAAALPGTVLHDEAERDVFAVPSLHLAATITRGRTPDTYSIVAWPEPSVASDRVVVLDTFNPTAEQVRAWAYAPHMRLTAQDEHLVVSHVACVPLLIELASDPLCAKRTYLLAIVDDFVASPSGPYDRELLARARTLASRATVPDLQQWAADLGYLAEYSDGRGPIGEDAARRVAGITMVGRRRPNVALEESAVEGWRIWTATILGQSLDRLHLSLAGGALVWSRRPLTVVDLAPHANPEKRDDPLRVRIETL